MLLLEGFGKVGLKDRGEDVRDIEFDRVGRGEFRRAGLTEFMELGKAGMGGIGTVWRIGVLGPKVFPAEAAGNGGSIGN